MADKERMDFLKELLAERYEWEDGYNNASALTGMFERELDITNEQSQFIFWFLHESIMEAFRAGYDGCNKAICSVVGSFRKQEVERDYGDCWRERNRRPCAADIFFGKEVDPPAWEDGEQEQECECEHGESVQD